MTLTDFLLARIADDEASCGGGDEPESWCDRATGAHYDPARVLAECEAKRRIVERCAKVQAVSWWEYDDTPNLADAILEDLALPYADHPDYREEWRP